MGTDLGVCDWEPTPGYGRRWLVSLSGSYELNGQGLFSQTQARHLGAGGLGKSW